MTAPDLILPREIDATQITCLRACPQKFKLEFCYGLRPTMFSVDLHAGGCFATGVETVGKAVHEHKLPLEVALQKGLAAYLDAWGDFVPMKDTPKTKERTWEAVEEYFKMWPPLTDHVQPHFIQGKPTYETTFAIPLEPVNSKNVDTGDSFPLHPSGEPFIYTGKLDRLGDWRGKLVGQDEKTTTSIGAKWSDQWLLRSQFMGYCWALQQMGLNVDTIIVRGIGILKTKFTLVEAAPTYTTFMLERWKEQLRRDLWRLRRMWDEGYFDFNLAEACTSYGGCPFNGLCTSPNPEAWMDQFTVRRWNPLLKNPVAEEKAA
ncbi:MAG TPA: PD-(D/E)XK nuclease family protein [Pyrinomonadaceae bacterium]